MDENIFNNDVNFQDSEPLPTYIPPQSEYIPPQTEYISPIPEPQLPKKPQNTPKPKKPKARFSFLTLAVAVIVAGAVGLTSATVTSAAFYLIFQRDAVVENTETEKNNISINVDEQALSVVEAVATKVTPSVVGIRTTTSVNSFFGNQQEASGEGSGVIYKENGYIITNYHVVEDAIVNKRNSKIEVFLDSSAENAKEATVVGYNISADLAVIKINVTGLSAIEIADSDNIKVGQYVITVGNPGGLEFMDSVTYGVISGLNRVVSSDSDIGLIQTDAAINPGNSGGALVDANGKLVGINSSKIVSEEFEGMGFAIPSNTAVEICNRIISKENSPEPYIGITLSEKYTAEVLEYYGYPTGGVVLSVYSGSPAYEAGIRKGDIVTEFNNETITDYTVLERLMNECEPDQKVSVKLYRSGRYYTTTITVGSNNAIG